MIGELLEQEGDEFADALEDPERVEFSPDNSEKIHVEPDDQWIRLAAVDIVNDNVEMRFNMQSSREKYVAVVDTDTFSLIESHGAYTINGKKGTSKLYYLVTDDELMIYDEGWREYFNPRPRKVAEELEDIRRQALEKGEYDELDWGEDEYVPPPKEDELFTD